MTTETVTTTIESAAPSIDIFETVDPKGAFFDSLNRNNKAIKKDRAVAITEAAQMLFKREIEDMLLEVKTLMRERQGMLDLSPKDVNSLILATDFDAKQYVNKEIEIGLKIRNLKIKLEIAQERYQALFS